MEEIRKLVREELTKLIKEEHFSDNNYGMPMFFNLKDYALRVEKKRAYAYEILQKLVTLSWVDNMPDKERLSKMATHIREWENEHE